MSNVLKRAKAIRSKHPGKSWAEVVKIASGKVSQKKPSAMATRKKAGTKRRTTGKKSVGAVRRRSSTRTKTKTVTRRRSVGAIIDNTLPQLAAGMALTGVIQGAIAPLRARVPMQMAKFVDPVIAILAYKGSQYFKNPVAKGACLGLMKSGVDGTVGVIMGAMGKAPMPMTPAVIAPPQQAAAAAASGYTALPTMGADIYMPLPASSLGEIRTYLAGNLNDNSYATIAPNETGESQVYNMPLGWKL